MLNAIFFDLREALMVDSVHQRDHQLAFVRRNDSLIINLPQVENI
jgi:hypothetical protein